MSSRVAASVVDGRAVQSAPLVHGDVMRLGNAAFRFEVTTGSSQLNLL